MRANVFDQLVLLPGPLQDVTASHGSTQDLPRDRLDTRVRLQRPAQPAESNAESSNAGPVLALPLPLVVRGIAAEHIGRRWADFCSMLGELQIPLCCSVKELAAVSVDNPPLRIGRRCVDQAFELAELEGSAAVEIDCRQSQTGMWARPSEADTAQTLEALLSAVRQVLSNASAPVGVTLPAGASESDLQWAVESGADFVTLIDSSRDGCSWLVVRSLNKLRETCSQRNMSDLPIIVDSPFRNTAHLSTCLAVGASLVSIDSFVKPLISEIKKAMLSIVGGEISRDLVKEIREHIQRLVESIEEPMRFCGARNLSELNPNCVRAITEQAAGLAGVSRL